VLNKKSFLAGLRGPCRRHGCPRYRAAATNPTYRFMTNLGRTSTWFSGPTSRRMTVANFLNYVNAGAYTNAIVDRSVPGFVEQGGDYTDPGGYPLLTATPVAIRAERSHQ
jgi:hypothetical protein